MVWVLCNIKNIAVKATRNIDDDWMPEHLSFVDKLQNNTIRVSRVKDWCLKCCRECLDREDGE